MRMTVPARQLSAANDDGSVQGASPLDGGTPDREDPELFGLAWVAPEIALDATILGADSNVPHLAVVPRD